MVAKNGHNLKMQKKEKDHFLIHSGNNPQKTYFLKAINKKQAVIIPVFKGPTISGCTSSKISQHQKMHNI